MLNQLPSDIYTYITTIFLSGLDIHFLKLVNKQHNKYLEDVKEISTQHKIFFKYATLSIYERFKKNHKLLENIPIWRRIFGYEGKMYTMTYNDDMISKIKKIHPLVLMGMDKFVIPTQELYECYEYKNTELFRYLALKYSKFIDHTAYYAFLNGFTGLLVDTEPQYIEILESVYENVI